jgi:RHS repeat-associated protein
MSRLTNACNPEAIASGTCTATSGPWSASYTYDANGNVTTRTDARGIVTHYTYDALNRLLGKTYANDPANTPTLTYGYDIEYPFQIVQDEDNPVGHLNSIVATLGTTNLVTWTSTDYDQRGNLTGYLNCLGSNAQSCPGFGAGTLLGYDLNEDLTSDTENAGGATFNGQYDYISYGYDSSGRMNAIAPYISIDTSGNSLTSTAFSGLTYYPGGAVETANLAIDPTSQVAGIALSRTYDNRGRITGQTDTDSQQQSAYTYTVSYDGNGNVSGYNDNVNGNWTATSDALHRLSSMTGTVGGVAATIQETYDHFGNRNVETVTYGSSQSQPSPYLNFTSGSNRIAGASYDNAGNLLSDGTNNYLYDAENRLCAVQQATTGGGLIGYLYAPDGTRLGRGNLTSFSCDLTKNGMLTANGLVLTNAYVVGPQGEELEEVDGNFNVLHFNVLWEGKLLGTYAGTTYAQSNWNFALNDWVGTKREVTNSAGSYSTSFSSGPFGDYQSQGGSGTDPSEQHFTGKHRDIESGLDYFPARYYNSYLGRFMSPDDVGGHLEDPQTLNLYSYVGNNPLSRTDPSGHDFYQSCDKASATCGNQNIGTNDNPVNHLVLGTTDSNGKFSAGIVTSASLSDPNSGNSAVVNGTGVQVTSAAGTAQGIFINGTPSADIKGQGAGFDQFSFHIDSNYAQRGVLAAGTATYLGSGGKQGMIDTINSIKVNGNGPFRYSEESTRFGNPFHPGEDNFRFSTGSDPENVNYGPSPHFAVPRGPGDTGDFHVDSKTGPAHLPCALVGIGCY